MRTIPPEAPGHQCALPRARGGYRSTGRPDGTLMQCDVCGTWWESRPRYEKSLGPTSRWGRVRFWNRRALRRIREAGR